MARVILRPGHGLCPPEAPSYDYSYCERGIKHWQLQRPGNREDDYTAEFCGEYLIPALRFQSHCVDTMRAIDPSVGQLDTSEVLIGPETLRGLQESQEYKGPRWRLSAAVEGALRGVGSCLGWAGDSWSFDPVAACRWEASIPDSISQECYLSIHQNWWHSQKIFGCVVLYAKGSRAGKQIANNIYDSIIAAFKGDEWIEETTIDDWSDRLKYRIRTGSRWGVQESRLWELRKTRRPAVLIELGFASNPEDADRMHDPVWQTRMSEAIARGLAA